MDDDPIADLCLALIAVVTCGAIGVMLVALI